MDARDKARTSPNNAQAVTSTLDRKRTAWKLPVQRDNLFVISSAIGSALCQWQQQQKPWRDAIQQVLTREEQAELITDNPSDRPVNHR
jgi:hypothetical protein